MRRIATLLVLAVGAVTAACGDDDNFFEGEFSLRVFETTDTCDGTSNVFQVLMEIDQISGNEFVVRFGDEAILEGTLNPDGVIVARGTSNAGGIEAEMLVNILVRRESTDGNGALTFDGTFPDVEGVCTQEFRWTRGDRLDSLAPSLPTEAS